MKTHENEEMVHKSVTGNNGNGFDAGGMRVRPEAAGRAIRSGRHGLYREWRHRQYRLLGRMDGPDLNTMQALVEVFNQQQTKIHVVFTSLQWTPLFTKFLTEMKGGNPPEVLVMHPFELGQFVEMGVLDSKPVASVGMDEANYSGFAWGGTKYKGEQYAVPLDVHMHGLYYNKELLEKAGISEAPKTGEELIAAAQKLTVDNNGKHAGEDGFDENNVVQYGLGFSMNHHVFYQIYALLNQQGNNPFTEDMASVDLDEEKTAKAIAFLQDLVFKYKVVPKGEKSPVDDFMGGKVAMFIDGPWQMPKLESSNIQWASAPYPQVFDRPPPGGRGNHDLPAAEGRRSGQAGSGRGVCTLAGQKFGPMGQIRTASVQQQRHENGGGHGRTGSIHKQPGQRGAAAGASQSGANLLQHGAEPDSYGGAGRRFEQQGSA